MRFPRRGPWEYNWDIKKDNRGWFPGSVPEVSDIYSCLVPAGSRHWLGNILPFLRAIAWEGETCRLAYVGGVAGGWWVATNGMAVA